MRSRGFTLIELIVVITIMTIVTGLALPRLVEQSKSARQNTCFSDFSTVMAMARYHAVETGQPQNIVIDMEQDAIFFAGNDGIRIKKRLTEGLCIDSVQRGTQKVGYGCVSLPFYPDGTSVYALIAIETDNKHHMLFSLDGATGNLAAQ